MVQSSPWCITSLEHTPHLTSPHLTSPHLTSPHLTSPHLTSPHLTSPHPTSPHLTSPHLTSPHLTSPHLTSPHLTPHHLTNTPPFTSEQSEQHSYPSGDFLVIPILPQVSTRWRRVTKCTRKMGASGMRHRQHAIRLCSKTLPLPVTSGALLSGHSAHTSPLSNGIGFRALT